MPRVTLSTPAPDRRPSATQPGPDGDATDLLAAIGTDPSEPTDDGTQRRRTLMTCLGCGVLAFIVVLAPAVVWWSWQDQAADVASSPSATQPPAASDPSKNDGDHEESEEPAEPTEEPTPDPVSPAPPDATAMSSVASPSGNIVCSLAGDIVSCSLREHRLSEHCPTDQPVSVQVKGEAEPRIGCGQDAGDPQAPQLDYGASATDGTVACTSRKDGMTCWNTVTGRGFMVARGTLDTF